ncbi:MAG: DoxX family protein [Chitinophagaceae bacterium]
MKKTKIYYWIFTGLLAALMLVSSIPDIIYSKEAVVMIRDHLGYPLYFLPFIGVAKFLGVVAILIPGFPRIKEWAYAGFVYDLTGAMYSMIAVGDPVQNWLPLIIGFIVIACSYIFHHKKLKAEVLNKTNKYGKME